MAILALVMLAGATAGAYAGATTPWNRWVNFSSSGTALCGQTKSTVLAEAVPPYDPTARGWERSLDNGCTDLHNRPAGYIGAATTFYRYSGGSWSLFWSSGGVRYTTMSSYFRLNDYYAPSQLDCSANNWRTNTVGRQWDSDSDSYHAPSSPTQVTQYTC